MNYLDVYFSRINHLGDTTAERIRNGGIRSFYKWMDESPHTIKNLSVERGLYFSGIILTSKDKEYEKIMFLNVANDTPIRIGDIMNWPLDDGSIEKWIVIQEEKKVNGTYRTFWIVRCNYLMKWIDRDGHLQQSWSYFVSSLDSKIKGNFRTWNSLITPQPNKYAEILMPRYPIDRATNFIVEEESWAVVEYDHTSVPGVIYLSLTENKINSIYDDVENNIADLDKLAKYSIVLPDANPQIFSLGEIKPVFTIFKNGVPYLNTEKDVEEMEKQIEYEVQQKSIVKNNNGKLVGIKAGITDVILKLKNDPSVQATLHIQIEETESQVTDFSLYIEGKDKVRLDNEEKYIYKTTGLPKEVPCVYKLLNAVNLSWVEEEQGKLTLIPAFEHPKIKNTYLVLENNPDWAAIETDNVNQLLKNYSEQYISSNLGVVKYKNENWFVHANAKNKLGYAILGCFYMLNNECHSAYKLLEIIPLW